jgi:hypothetical protein
MNWQWSGTGTNSSCVKCGDCVLWLVLLRVLQYSVHSRGVLWGEEVVAGILPVSASICFNRAVVMESLTMESLTILPCLMYHSGHTHV